MLSSTFKIVDDDLNVAFAGGRLTILRADPKLLSRIERFDITRDDMGQAPEEEVLILRALNLGQEKSLTISFK